MLLLKVNVAGGGSALIKIDNGMPNVFNPSPIDLLPDDVEDVVKEQDVVEVEKDPKDAKPIPT